MTSESQNLGSLVVLGFLLKHEEEILQHSNRIVRHNIFTIGALNIIRQQQFNIFVIKSVYDLVGAR